MKSIKVNFVNQSGIKLVGILETPTGTAPSTYAIFAHCFTCTKNIRAATVITRALARKGVATLRFDFAGLGQSEGSFEESTFSSNTEDVIAAASFLEKEYKAPQILIGHSLGGAAVLHAACDIPSVTSVATIGAPYDPEHVAHLFQCSLEQIMEKGSAEVTLAGRQFKINSSFIEDLKDREPDKIINKMDKALLVLHSPIDDTVGIENAAKIYAAAKHPKSFITLDSADHLLTKKEDANYAAQLIASWVERYIEKTTQELSPEKGIVIAQTGAESLYTEVMANTHSIIADEPASVGGTELGPTPYDYLMTALASCTSMTLRMYADRKKITLNSVKVYVTYEKTYAQDCKDCENSKNKIDVFTREVELDGELSEEQKNRMIEIADMCPVHKTLHSNLEIRTKLRS